MSYPQPDLIVNGEEIFLGPYNKDQAPYLECAHCGQPITVGQRYVPWMAEVILGITRTGQLRSISTPDQEGGACCHSECSPYYAHEHIAEDGHCQDNPERTRQCEYCENDVMDGYRVCASCTEKMGLPG